jgi:murein DD-endopeptidase MepM/ murein hydrolase activator NlpD
MTDWLTLASCFVDEELAPCAAGAYASLGQAPVPPLEWCTDFTGDFANPVFGSDGKLAVRHAPSGQGDGRFGLVRGGGRKMHNGIDIVADVGTPVMASESGIVVFSGDITGTYGRTVVVAHPDGTSTLYAHLQDESLAPLHSRVRKGTLLGRVGTTGNAEGTNQPHLHFERFFGSQAPRASAPPVRTDPSAIAIAQSRASRWSD